MTCKSLDERESQTLGPHPSPSTLPRAARARHRAAQRPLGKPLVETNEQRWPRSPTHFNLELAILLVILVWVYVLKIAFCLP